MRKLLGALYIVYGLIVFFAIMFLVLPFIILSSFIPNKFGATIPFFFLRVWAYGFSFLTLFFYKVYGRNKIDKSKPYIYVANHGSYLDATSVVIASPTAFKPLGKIEMSRIPFFGFIYKRVVVMVDRSTKESRTESVEKLKIVLKNGISILIFPEGTMNRTENYLKNFYDGAFRIAIETQTPIAPFVVLNAKKLMPRNNPLFIRPGIMNIHFADPIEVTNYSIDQLDELKLKVFKTMEDLMIKNQTNSNHA
jgi:1-acyl-sn-glycerol-3-phosphate acyltransferase